MTTSDDKVVYPDAFLAARDAAKAMADYKAGHGKSIHAVIEYGRALLRGRGRDRSNSSFQMWVSDNKLDVGDPWKDRFERAKAMQIAEIVVGSVPTSTLSIPTTIFDACLHTRPTDIMKWYRKIHGPINPTRPKLATQIETAYQAILDWRKNGRALPSNMKDFAPMIGVSVKASQKAYKRFRQGTDRIVEVPVKPPEPVIADDPTPTDQSHFSEKSKLRIEDAIRIHQARLEKTFETKVGEAVRRHIDAADEAMRKQNAQLRKENLAVNMLLQQGALFTPDEYKTILRCLHPDNSASPEVRARAFDLVKQKERRLTGQ